MIQIIRILKVQYQNVLISTVIIAFFLTCLNHSYLLFHVFIELFAVVIAYSLFTVTWNSRKALDNQYLFFIGFVALFIGILDTFHVITYQGMNIIQSPIFYANQFWIATRFLESVAMLIGFIFLKSKIKLRSDTLLTILSLITFLIIMSILYWEIFPVCYIKDVGQTKFKIFSEYIIILILFISLIFLIKNKQAFEANVFKLLVGSIVFTIITEFCFTLYISNFGFANQLGHFTKLVSFYLIYKANVETGFVKPTETIFRNLKENEEKTLLILNSTAEGIYGIDLNGLCTFANKSCIKLLGYQSEEELLGKNMHDLVHYKNLDNQIIKVEHCKIHLAFKQGKGTHAEDEIFWRADGSNFPVEYWSYPQLKNAQIIGAVVTFNDISNRKINDEKILKYTQELKDLNATKDKFFSIIAHDLKNPFNTLLGFNELLVKNAATYTPEKVQQFALHMYNTSRHTYALLENLLEWSRLQTGKLNPNPVKAKPSELIYEVKLLCEEMSKTKNIALHSIINCDEYILADKEMIKTVLRNLVTNALKFTKPEGKVKIETRNGENNVLFIVSDTGIGIEPEHIGKLFRIDRKLSKTGTADEKGTGLGLILCKEFVEKHGGTIWVESEVGKGSDFKFTLPVCS